MNKYSMTEALTQAIQLRGIEIILNKRSLSAALGDMLPGDSHRVERMVLLQPLEIDEWRTIAETHTKGAAEHARALSVVSSRLKEILGWTDERCNLVLDCYASALGWNDDDNAMTNIVTPLKSPLREGLYTIQSVIANLFLAPQGNTWGVSSIPFKWYITMGSNGLSIVQPDNKLGYGFVVFQENSDGDVTIQFSNLQQGIATDADSLVWYETDADSHSQAEYSSDKFWRLQSLSGSVSNSLVRNASAPPLVQQVDIPEFQVADVPTPPTTALSTDLLSTIVKFGTYKKKPIEWIVLNRQADRVLLLARKTLTKIKYHKKTERTTWAECSLREYLNGEFFGTCFSIAERSAVILTHNDNPDTVYTTMSGSKIVTYGGAETDDHIFLLSIEDVEKLFDLTIVQTNESKRKKESEKKKNIYPNELLSSQNLCTPGFTSDWWWLRSPGSESSSAVFVDIYGIVSIWGMEFYMTLGLRPAMWVKADSITN